VGEARSRVAQFLANFWHGELIGQLLRQLATAGLTVDEPLLKMGYPRDPHLAPPSYGPCRTRRSPFVRLGGDQSAPSRESAPRKPPTMARITTAATNSSAVMSGSLLAAAGPSGLHLAGDCGLAEQLVDVQLRHHGGVVQDRRGHDDLLRCLH
jgi:hypothetical protein